MTTVQSSNLAGVDYDGQRTLVIAFRSGRIYEFVDVPLTIYEGLMHASSHGKYFHAQIKKRYSFRRLS